MIEVDFNALKEKIELPENEHLNAKHIDGFGKVAQYKGNGIYEMRGFYSTDTRDLFLVYVALQEDWKIPEEENEE